MPKKTIFNKKLKKGRFYLVHEGSKTGHPGMIYWKNDNKNLYLALTTGTSYNKMLIRLYYPTAKNIKISYVNKKLFLGKRKDFGGIEKVNLKFNKKDKKMILREISKKEPRYSKNISRKDKNYFRRLRKKKCIKY